MRITIFTTSRVAVYRVLLVLEDRGSWGYLGGTEMTTLHSLYLFDTLRAMITMLVLSNLRPPYGMLHFVTRGGKSAFLRSMTVVYSKLL